MNNTSISEDNRRSPKNVKGPNSQLSFADRLKLRRRELGYSQQQLAQKVGVSKNTIQNYESGTLPKGEHAISLSKALNASIDWLFKGEGPLPPKPEYSNTINPKGCENGVLNIQETSRQYSRLSSLDIRLLKTIIEKIERGLKARDITLDVSKKAETIALFYDLNVGTGKPVDDNIVDRYLHLII